MDQDQAIRKRDSLLFDDDMNIRWCSRCLFEGGIMGVLKKKSRNRDVIIHTVCALQSWSVKLTKGKTNIIK